MATFGNCKKTAEKKQTEGKNLNSSANPSPLKASDRNVNRNDNNYQD